MTETRLIATGHLTRDMLSGQVAVVTGAGRGIGLETARSLAWLGARVVVAEVDRRTGEAAARQVNAEFGRGSALFVQTDVGDERSVARLAQRVLRQWGRVDVVVNNATVTPMGAVKDVPVASWDRSYRVNLRGPVLLARAFLPGMLVRDAGVFACVSSSGAMPFMGAYEVFKTAQVELANTLAAELEGTGVSAFTIGPGLVRTPGAEAGISQLAALYGKTVEEFYALSAAHIISVEAAGAGFAAAVALAGQFRGQEIGAKQALVAAGIDLEGPGGGRSRRPLTEDELGRARELSRAVKATLNGQRKGWEERPLFERQWCVRDFRKAAGLTVEEWLAALDRLESYLAAGAPGGEAPLVVPLERLAGYYAHLADLARGYEKDQAKLKEHLAVVDGWRVEAERLAQFLEGTEDA